MEYFKHPKDVTEAKIEIAQELSEKIETVLQSYDSYIRISCLLKILIIEYVENNVDKSDFINVINHIYNEYVKLFKITQI